VACVDHAEQSRNRIGIPLISLPHLEALAESLGFTNAVSVHDAAARAARVARLGRTVQPFALTPVKLADSLFTQQRDRMLAYARGYGGEADALAGPDRVPPILRANAGLDTRGAQPVGSWENGTGYLRGHYAGHFLSMLVQSYAGTGDEVYKQKLNYMVKSLAECQDALAAAAKLPTAHATGKFGSALKPSGSPIGLAEHVSMPAGVVNGLRDFTTSLWISLAQHHRTKLKNGRTSQSRALHYVHALHRWRTGRDQSEHDAFARRPGRDQRRNTRRTSRESTHSPVHWRLRAFEQNDVPEYKMAATNFGDMVVPHRVYAHGGVGVGEIIRKRDVVAGSLWSEPNNHDHAETCVAYNMLKLSWNLFFHDPDPKYMSFYEHALFNQILGSRRDNTGNTSPEVTYFEPVRPGERRNYGNAGTCCGGTGMENHTKYQDSIYFRSADDVVLYVNLYIPSVLGWREKAFTIEQVTRWLGSRLRCEATGAWRSTCAFQHGCGTDTS